MYKYPYPDEYKISIQGREYSLRSSHYYNEFEIKFGPFDSSYRLLLHNDAEIKIVYDGVWNVIYNQTTIPQDLITKAILDHPILRKRLQKWRTGTLKRLPNRIDRHERETRRLRNLLDHLNNVQF